MFSYFVLDFKCFQERVMEVKYNRIQSESTLAIFTIVKLNETLKG